MLDLFAVIFLPPCFASYTPSIMLFLYYIYVSTSVQPHVGRKQGSVTQPEA